MLILDQRDNFIEYINNLFRRNRYGIFCNTTEEEFYDLFKDRDKWLCDNLSIDPLPDNRENLPEGYYFSISEIKELTPDSIQTC